MADHETVEVAVTYEVPVVWRDDQYGRDRLGVATARSPLRIPVVDPASFRAMPAPRVRGTQAADPAQSASQPLMRDGKMWRRWDRGHAPEGSAALHAFASDVLGGARACDALAVNLPIELTGKRGAARDAYAPGLMDRATIWRADVQAEALARAYVAGHLAFDGKDVLVASGWNHGRNATTRKDDLSGSALSVLMAATRITGVEPEVERLSTPVRKAVALASVAALEEGERVEAAEALARLAEATANHVPPDQAPYMRQVADRMDAFVEARTSEAETAAPRA